MTERHPDNCESSRLIIVVVQILSFYDPQTSCWIHHLLLNETHHNRVIVHICKPDVFSLYRVQLLYATVYTQLCKKHCACTCMCKYICTEERVDSCCLSYLHYT